MKLIFKFYFHTYDLAHISLVVPAFLAYRMVLNDENKNKSRNYLIKYLKIEFNFELSSKEYLVAIWIVGVKEALHLNAFKQD